MTSSTHDEGFRDLQLSGKQLVFLFMAVTVVSVVIFLCGVLVGRGVRAERGVVGTTEVAAPAIVEPPLSPVAAAAPNTSNPLVTAGEKLTYAERLGGSEPTAENLKAAPPPPPPVVDMAPPTPTKAASRPAPPSATPVFAEPPGAGFAIQLAALRERSEADAIVSRLTSRGYSAYVVAPARGAPSVFRVRVGKFQERREADAVAARLQKEEHFKPWVVR
ncbi:MAG: SPOR domain-containing protein [Vicinamibacterales bacterium]